MSQDHASQLMNLAVQHVQRKEWPQALAAFEELLALRPNDPQVLYNKGLVHLQMGQLEPAQVVLRRAVQLKPDYAQAKAALRQVEAQLSAAPPAPPVQPLPIGPAPPPPIQAAGAEQNAQRMGQAELQRNLSRALAERAAGEEALRQLWERQKAGELAVDEAAYDQQQYLARLQVLQEEIAALQEQIPSAIGQFQVDRQVYAEELETLERFASAPTEADLAGLPPAPVGGPAEKPGPFLERASAFLQRLAERLPEPLARLDERILSYGGAAVALLGLFLPLARVVSIASSLMGLLGLPGTAGTVRLFDLWQGKLAALLIVAALAARWGLDEETTSTAQLAAAAAVLLLTGLPIFSLLTSQGASLSFGALLCPLGLITLGLGALIRHRRGA